MGRPEIADYLDISPVVWDKWVTRGFAPEKVTPDGVHPRWKAAAVREFCRRAHEQAVLPLRYGRKPVNIGNPAVSDDCNVDRNECAAYLGVTVGTWMRMVANGKAPKKRTPEGFYPKWKAGDIRKFFSK